MYFVSERAREDVKDKLVCQGPEELFEFYTRHLGVQYGHYWRSMPGWMRRGVERGIGRLSRNESLKRGVYSLNIEDRVRRYQNVFSIMPGETVDSLFRPEMLPQGAGDSIVD